MGDVRVRCARRGGGRLLVSLAGDSAGERESADAGRAFLIGLEQPLCGRYGF